jgi:hypothetical protein
MRRQTIRIIVEHPAALFCLLFVAGQLAAFATPGRSVVPAYYDAANRWFAGENIYNLDGYGFVYLPQSALLFAPFALLPSWLSDIAWRCVNVGLFAWGFKRLATLVSRDWDLALARHFSFWAALVCLPTCFSTARNGQMTLVMGALMMLAVADAAERRWWRAAIFVTLGVGFKTLAAVLLLLLGAMYRPLRWRLALSVVALALMPYACGSPDYVTRQYVDAVECLRLSAVEGLKCPWATVFGVLDVTGLQLSHTVQAIVRTVVALATLAACVWAKNLKPERTALYVFTFASLYILLFSPRTENNTYALLGPSLGIWAAWAFWYERNYVLSTLHTLLTVAVIASYEVGKFFTDVERGIWLAPLAGCVFTALVVRDLRRELRARSTAPEANLSFPGSTGSEPQIGISHAA